MQTILFTFAYLMIFLFAFSILWAVGAELLILLNIKLDILTPIKNAFINLYRAMQQLNLRIANAKKFNLPIGKSFSQAS
jgi:hypothetical protein